MFLAISDLMKQLLSNIGHAIDRISPRQLTVYLIFEVSYNFLYILFETNRSFVNFLFYSQSIPLKEQVNDDAETDHCYNERVRRSRLLMKKLLKEKFDPPILVSKNATGKICKLINKSVLAYLQSKHCE